jgi:hypothetical protein
MDDEYLALAARSGCKQLFLGLESVTQDSLDASNKALKQRASSAIDSMQTSRRVSGVSDGRGEREIFERLPRCLARGLQPEAPGPLRPGQGRANASPWRR